MRQKQTLAFLSLDLHRKGLVPDVPIVPAVQSLAAVQSSKGSTFNVHTPLAIFQTPVGGRSSNDANQLTHPQHSPSWETYFRKTANLVDPEVSRKSPTKEKKDRLLQFPAHSLLGGS
jgi:hypothetical protein